MRTLLVLLAGLTLAQASVSKADEQDLDLDQADYSAELDRADVVGALRAGGYNRWTCTAKRVFNLRMYRASSFYFRQQSGEGQEAKRVAQKIALRNCEFATGATCTANLADCQVETH